MKKFVYKHNKSKYAEELEKQKTDNLKLKNEILDELKAIGCDTAKSVLDLSIEELTKRTDLEEVSIKEVIKILRSEFE